MLIKKIILFFTLLIISNTTVFAQNTPKNNVPISYFYAMVFNDKSYDFEKFIHTISEQNKIEPILLKEINNGINIAIYNTELYKNYNNFDDISEQNFNNSIKSQLLKFNLLKIEKEYFYNGIINFFINDYKYSDLSFFNNLFEKHYNHQYTIDITNKINTDKTMLVHITIKDIDNIKNKIDADFKINPKNSIIIGLNNRTIIIAKIHQTSYSEKDIKIESYETFSNGEQEIQLPIASIPIDRNN